MAQAAAPQQETRHGCPALCKQWRVQQGALGFASSTLLPCTNNQNMVIAGQGYTTVALADAAYECS